MLTREALHERRWRPFPLLAELLDGKQLGINWTGPTSVSPNVFDDLPILLHIYALVVDNKDEVECAMHRIGPPTQREFEILTYSHSFRDELARLSSMLANASEMFASASKDIARGWK